LHSFSQEKQLMKLKVPPVLVRALLIMGALFALLFFFTRSHTPEFRDGDNRILPNSVASLEKVELGGLEQWILIRGKDQHKPVVLFLHGGPGMPMMYLAHAFQRELEHHCVAVQWDQRGAGKSYSKKVPVESLTVEQMIADTRQLTELLQERFQEEKIYLVGHSWGSYLGMLVAQRHPENYHAFVGMGQVTDAERAQVIQEAFIRRQAQQTGKQEALKDLAEHGAAAHEKWLFKFGAEIKNATSWLPLLKVGLGAPEYGLTDYVKIQPGSSFCSRHMKYNVLVGTLLAEVLHVGVPVYFFTGRYDYTTPFELVEIYLDRLAAPQKELVWFPHSAHFPFFEEPERFTAEMIRVIAETYPRQGAS
jgi:pimeloyl-ACP methyl ester carboxylesterase